MATADSTPDPAELIQLLDEHHLVILTEPSAESRLTIERTLCDTLHAMSETDVIELEGHAIATLKELNQELSLHRGDADRSNGTARTLLTLFRTWPGQPHHRYIVWHDAEIMLEANVQEFNRAVNTLCLIAAMFEHLDLTSLVLHRFIFIGGPKLGAYAENVNGQFNAWLRDVDEPTILELVERVEPIVPRPPVLVYRLVE